MTSYFLAFRPGDHAVPDLFHKFALALDLLAQGGGDVDIKTGGLAVGRLEGEGLVGWVDGDLEHGCFGSWGGGGRCGSRGSSRSGFFFFADCGKQGDGSQR